MSSILSQELQKCAVVTRDCKPRGLSGQISQEVRDTARFGGPFFVVEYGACLVSGEAGHTPNRFSRAPSSSTALGVGARQTSQRTTNHMGRVPSCKLHELENIGLLLLTASLNLRYAYVACLFHCKQLLPAWIPTVPIHLHVHCHNSTTRVLCQAWSPNTQAC